MFHRGTSNKEIGDLGERIARQFLEKNDCRIIAANYRQKFGEIDLIAREPTGTLIFVEVKTMTISQSGLRPEDHLNKSKLKRMQRVAQFFANDHSELIDEDQGWRIDLVAVLLQQKIGEQLRAKIKHYKGLT